jgi:hypothetical protein
MEEVKIGFISNYFGKISVAAVEITDGTVHSTLHADRAQTGNRGKERG